MDSQQLALQRDGVSRTTDSAGKIGTAKNGGDSSLAGLTAFGGDVVIIR